MATTLPNEKPGNIIAVGIPAKNGLWSYRFGLSLWQMGVPINCSTMPIIVYGKPVDEARNIIVEQAKLAGAKYLFFIDDDNLIPPFALPRLLNLKTKVASGVYYTKNQPPTPVILKKDYPGGWDRWTYGDVIEVDYIGLGCALIDMTVFDDIEPPYFKYVKCGTDPKQGVAHVGEDVYFCDKVLKAGHKIYVDTYVQVGHEDFANSTTYLFFEPAHCGAWQVKDGPIQWLPSAAKWDELHKIAEDAAVSTPKLSWGYGSLEGYVEAQTVDVVEIRKRFKDVEEVKIRNVFEYRNPEECLSLMHAVMSVAKLGANLEVRVPDSIPKIRTLSEESDAAFIDKFTGCPEARFKSYYTKGNIEEIAKLLNIQEVSVVVEGEEIVLKGKV